ncbi:MAG: SEC-C domain-containing protein [Bacteroidales bacterium]|nr:SEC-C domain-containing protein [Bacteroidales bacterium]
MVKIFGQKMTDKVSKSKSKIGRNDKCPCGSGEKFKNCCGK